MSRDAATSRGVLLAAVAAICLGLLAGAVPAGRVDVRDRTSLAHHLYRMPVNLQTSLASPLSGASGVSADSGWTLGGETITYSEGGRDARKVRGASSGRMSYTGTRSWEPTLGIDKKGNIFFQGTPFATDINVMVSRDGGRSWEEITPRTHTHTMDPLIYVDKDTGRAFTADLTWPCLTVSHTDDVGKSWITSEACGLTDHQNMFAGPPVSSPTVGYPNIVYMCAMDGGAATNASTATSCVKSLDGGVAWIRTGTPAYPSGDPRHEEGMGNVPGWCDGGTGHGVADSHGVLYLPRGWCGQPYLAISKDEGLTWERIQVAKNGMPFTDDGIPGMIRLYAHEAAVAVDDEGNIYYFWVARDQLPYLAVSTDKGKSFSKPIMVGPPGLTRAWGPTMDIGATGKIALAYVGSTTAPGGVAPYSTPYPDTVTWNGYITTSVDALAKNPRFFTTSVNSLSDPIDRGCCENWAQGDFIDVVVGPDGRPYTSMVDGCAFPGDACGDRLGFVGTVVGGPKLR